MSLPSTSSSPLAQYALEQPDNTSDIINFSAHNDPHHVPPVNHIQEISNDVAVATPLMTSSPIIHSESLGEFMEGDSVSSLGTPYTSLPPLRRPSPYMVPLNSDEVGVIPPNGSPLLRPASGRLMGGMKKLLRIPSSVQAGVASSSVHAENPSVAIVTNSMDPTHPELEHTDRKIFINKVLTHIKRPRNHRFSGLRRHRVRKHTSSRSTRERSHHHHYSDDGYTSDPGLLRDAITHEEDVEEEDDTESGDHDMEQRAQRISAIENKLEKYKKLLQEEESNLQGCENEYVQGMEGSMSDKETHRIKQRFITKQSKTKDTIEHLKKKVDKYEYQLQYIKQGGDMAAVSTQRYGNKMKSGIKRIGGMRNELKERLRRKKSAPNAQATIDEDEDDLEEEAVVEEEEEEDEMVEPSAGNELMKDSHSMEYYYSSLAELVKQSELQKQAIRDIQKQSALLADKLLAEKDKSERLESELNTLMDLHQHGVTELKEQLTQMERLTFSKNQELEDTVENCQSRLHKLEVEVNKTVDEKKTPVPSSWIRRVFVPLLTFLLDFLSFMIRISEHIGRRAAVALLIVAIAVFVFYWFAYSL